MPSTSPGSHAPTTPTPFEQILPGKPVAGYQSLATFMHRHGRYVAYISGRQLNILSSPTHLLQAITFREPLVCVTAEAKSGKLAVATREGAWVLEPVTEGWSKTWWERVLHLRRGDPGDEARWLSWGGDGELLVGGTRHLRLFSTVPSSRSSSPPVAPLDGGKAVEERMSLWSKAVSSPIRWAAFSPSANIIATCGERDRLVKIWRRLSFEEGLFDHTYLPHPGVVTHLQWRPLEEGFEERRGSGKSGRHDDDPEVLHTIANDGVLRVWRTGSVHDMDVLILHTTVNLIEAIPQLSLAVKALAPPSAATSPRYAFTIPAFHFTAAVKAAMGLQTPEAKLSHTLEHLEEVSSKEPDIVVALDGHGRMSAWGLQSIGHKRRPETPSGLSKQAFHIAHCEDLSLKLSEGEVAAFETWFEDSTLNLLSRGLHGELRWWKGDTEHFFSPAAGGTDRLMSHGAWSGMDQQISGLRGMAIETSGTEFASYSVNGAVSHWCARGDAPFRCASSYALSNTIVDASIVHSTAFLVTLEGSKPTIMFRNQEGEDYGGEELVTGNEEAQDCHIFTSAPSTSLEFGRQRFVAMYNTAHSANGRACAFTIDDDGIAFSDMVHLTFEAPNKGADSLQLAAIVDADEPDRFGVVGLTNDGHLLLWHVELTEDGELVEQNLMAAFESGVKLAGTWIATNAFAALTSEDGLGLTIIDLRDGYIELQQDGRSPIQRLCPSSKGSVLAVGYEHYIDVLAQGHYAQNHRCPAWHHIRQVSVAGMGLSICELAWLGDGRLAVGAGNGILITSGDLAAQELQMEIREALDLEAKDTKDIGLSPLTDLLKMPHAVWHPDLLIHLVHCGRWALAAALVVRLVETLKFWSEGDYLNPHLSVPPEQLYGAQGMQHQTILDQDVVNELHQQLDEKNMPQLSNMEQAHLRRVLDAMLFCAEHVRGLDDCALRFLFAWKLALLDLEANSPRTNGNTPNGVSRETPSPQMHWREIAFAHQSTTQQPLLDILTLAYDNKISWHTARNLGLFAWLSDREALAQIFEALAQSAYRASSPPDPINATLYFLALHKKSTLLGLWRIATWHKEQKATMNFLRRDFDVEANRTAAKKNAYALMGKRRFDYAASFFLLAEDAASATSVLAGQCGDVMLAIAVARLYAGDGSSVLRKLVEDRLLPDATKQGNRWQASWSHSILFEKQRAAEALVTPLQQGVKRWEMDDPHTLTLYRQLRTQESEWEWEAVLRAARLLRKMGLWFAALELVRSWKFQDPREVVKAQDQQSLKIAQTNGVADDFAAPPSMLDDYSSPVPSHDAQPASMVDAFTSPAPTEPAEPPSMLDGFITAPSAPEEDEQAARKRKAAELLQQLKAKKEGKGDVATANEKVQGKRQPTQFKEPSADSLLDNFGF